MKTPNFDHSITPTSHSTKTLISVVM